MYTVDWEISRYRSGEEPERLSDRVVAELPLEIRVNGRPLVVLMRLPGQDEELAAGFLITERVIGSVEQIKLLRRRGVTEDDIAAGDTRVGEELGSGSMVEIEVESPGGTGRFDPRFVIRTGSGGADMSASGEYRPGMVSSELRVMESAIYGMGEALTGRQEIFRSTGGTHGAGIFTAGGEVVVTAEDVGRHNALDKAVGRCALGNIPLEDKVLVLSGRISYEMALKAARARIPVLVSMAAPTSLGLRVADDAGLTVVGFSDGRRFNVYTHRRRIER